MSARVLRRASLAATAGALLLAVVSLVLILTDVAPLAAVILALVGAQLGWLSIVLLLRADAQRGAR